MDNTPGVTLRVSKPDNENSGDTSSRSFSPRSLASLSSMSPGWQAAFAIATQAATWGMQYLALRTVLPEIPRNMEHVRSRGEWLPLALTLLATGIIVAPLATLKGLRIAAAARKGKSDPP